MDINDYIFKGKRHEAYLKTVELYERVKRHAQGKKQIDLITERRPSESDDIKSYREKIFVAITKGEGVGLVLNALGKIRRSSDWMIKYPAVETSIKDEETLDAYCEKNFPYFQSVTFWAFSVLLKEYITDANAVVLVTPLVIPKTESGEPDTSSFLRPVPLIFNSDNVYELTEDFALLKSTEKAFYNPSTRKWEGNVYYHVTPQTVSRIEETNNKTLTTTIEFTHNFGVLPIAKTKGIYCDIVGNTPVYESRIMPMIPRLDEFVREYSDMQSEVVQHLNSEKWTFITQDCQRCMMDGVATGKVKKNNKNVVCPDCNGTGRVIQSPYKTSVVRSSKKNMGEQDVPIPPSGYVQKNTDIVKVQQERLDQHMYKAFCAIAMQHLFQMPLNVSGYKKELDMDESITFITNVAEDIVNVLDKVYYFTNEWRYSDAVPNEKKRRSQLPVINVPQRFDIISTDYLGEELAKAKTNKFNPLIIRTMEVELISKKFANNPELRDELMNLLELDPLPYYTVDEKNAMLQSNGITEEDYIISCNIQSFVKRGFEENNNFFTLPYSERYDKMKEYAQEIIKAEKEEMTESE